MPRTCKVCISPSRRKLDRLLLEGQTFAHVARIAGLSDDAVRRHFHGHLQQALQRHAEANRQAVAYGSRLAEQLQYISDQADSILRQAQAAGQLGVALKALAELRESAKLLAVSMGELESEGHKTQIAIQVNSDKLDKLVDEDVQIRIALCYLQHHAPHLLARDTSFPTAIPGSQGRPELTRLPQGESAIPRDFVEGN